MDIVIAWDFHIQGPLEKGGDGGEVWLQRCSGAFLCSAACPCFRSVPTVSQEAVTD